MCTYMWVHVHVDARKGQEKMLNHLGLEFQAVVDQPTYLPGTKLEPSGRAASTFTC